MEQPLPIRPAMRDNGELTKNHDPSCMCSRCDGRRVLQEVALQRSMGNVGPANDAYLQRYERSLAVRRTELGGEAAKPYPELAAR